MTERTWIVLAKGPRERRHHVYGDHGETLCRRPAVNGYVTEATAEFYGHDLASTEDVMADPGICQRCRHEVGAPL